MGHFIALFVLANPIQALNNWSNEDLLLCCRLQEFPVYGGRSQAQRHLDNLSFAPCLPRAYNQALSGVPFYLKNALSFSLCVTNLDF
jgi:hypothetical protein